MLDIFKDQEAWSKLGVEKSFKPLIWARAHSYILFAEHSIFLLNIQLEPFSNCFRHCPTQGSAAPPTPSRLARRAPRLPTRLSTTGWSRSRLRIPARSPFCSTSANQFRMPPLRSPDRLDLFLPVTNSANKVPWQCYTTAGLRFFILDLLMGW